MSTVSEYRQEIASAVSDMREMIVLVTRMIEEGQDKAALLAVIRSFIEKVETVETESILQDANAVEKSIALAYLHQQRDTAYRERAAMARVLRQYQEEHLHPSLPSAVLKENLEEKEATRKGNKNNKKPRQLSLFP